MKTWFWTATCSTANGPGAAMLFGYCIGEYLGEDLQVAQLKEQMCYTGL